MSTQVPSLPVATQAPVVPASPPQPAATFVIVGDHGQVRIPAGLTTHEAFREWARSDDCPEKGRFGWLNGLIWVDLTMEQLYTHNDVKSAFAVVLSPLGRASRIGRYFGDGMLLSHAGAGLSTAPDGLFILHTTFQSGQILEVAGRHPGVIEFEGVPDMVLEVVSDSSEEKDYHRLPAQYYQAGISEFWRADARGELRFEIFRRTDSGYVPTQTQDGWWHSDLFGRDFLLTRQADERGQPEFTLQVR